MANGLLLIISCRLLLKYLIGGIIYFYYDLAYGRVIRLKLKITLICK